eukprot:m.50213 g.50213  ORF g.50213 m.50213 type:complete len:523 (+) comp48082_c0_seq1:103-1671(+)
MALDLDALLQAHGPQVIFYGFSVAQLAPSPGHFTSIDAVSLQLLPDDVHRHAALERRLPLAALGPDYEHLLVVATPQADLTITPVENEGSKAETSWAVDGPLVKSREGDTLAIASGIRSALLPLADGRWLRLKGCGNNYDGFPTRKMLTEDGSPLLVAGRECFEIRGCCFQHTAALEQFMARKISEALRPVGIQVGNVPLGWFAYDSTTPAHPYPAVGRYCGIFETIGDRRLSDHVLRGLELLLPELILSSPTRVDAGTCSFPEGVFGPRPGSTSGCFEEADSTFMQYACGGSERPDCFADLSEQSLSLSCTKLREYCRVLPPCLQPVWMRHLDALEQFLLVHGGNTSLLGYLFWTLGFECGTAIRALAREQISWGSFRDLGGTHCNAHGNNFVLKAPTADLSRHSNFLALVDFDLAFSVDDYLRTGDAATDHAEARELVAMELNALGMDLAASQNTTGTKNDHQVPESVVPLRWGLRDTLVRAYLISSSGEHNPHPPRSEFYSACYSLLSLAILRTHETIA